MATAHTGINTRLVVVQKSSDSLFSSSASGSFAKEKAEILKTASRGKDGHPLAPNGKRSNLTEDQWATVRTGSFKRWFGDWQAATNRTFLESNPVATLTGDEFKSDGVPLTEKVPQWYGENGVSMVEVEGIGPIRLDAQAVKNSLSHGIGRDKAAAFAAVPDILRLGRIIHSEELRGSINGQVHHISAPIRMAAKDYVADVLVKSDANIKRMYVHEVVLREKLQRAAFKTGAVAAEAGKPPGSADVGAMKNILQSLFAVNSETVSKLVDENGEPMVVHHGSAQSCIIIFVHT